MIILLLYAVPHELSFFARSLGVVCTARSPYRIFETDYGSKRLILVQTGMGAPAVKTALHSQVNVFRPDLVISAGFAGAIDNQMSVGQVVFAAQSLLCDNFRVLDSIEIPLLRELFSVIPPLQCASVITSRQLMRKQALRNIFSSLPPLPVCDMETYDLACACRKERLPFIGIRSISDDWLTEIPPALLRVCDDSGVYSVRKALLVLASHPSLIPTSMALGLRARLAARQLSRTILAVLDVLP